MTVHFRLSLAPPDVFHYSLQMIRYALPLLAACLLVSDLIAQQPEFDVFDMPTTASAIALAGFVPPDDAYQVRKLREAGAVFIGKTNLHEFARGIETVSSLGGYTLRGRPPDRAGLRL